LKTLADLHAASFLFILRLPAATSYQQADAKTVQKITRTSKDGKSKTFHGHAGFMPHTSGGTCPMRI
jgi:hypothetical protein